MSNRFKRGDFIGFRGLDTHAFTPPVASAKALLRGLARKVNLSAKLRGAIHFYNEPQHYSELIGDKWIANIPDSVWNIGNNVLLENTLIQ